MLDYNEFVLEQADCMDVIDEFDVYCIQEGMFNLKTFIKSLPMIILNFIRSLIKKIIFALKSIKHNLDSNKIKNYKDENGNVKISLPEFMSDADECLIVINKSKEFMAETLYTFCLILNTLTLTYKGLKTKGPESFDINVMLLEQWVDMLKKLTEISQQKELFKNESPKYTTITVDVELAQSYYVHIAEFHDHIKDYLKQLNKKYNDLEKAYNDIKSQPMPNLPEIQNNFEKQFKDVIKYSSNLQKDITTALNTIQKCADGIKTNKQVEG